MAKFKQFLITEDIGFADLGPRLDRLYNSSYLDSKIGGALTSSNNGSNMPDIELEIPSTVRSGRITNLMLRKNPIYIRLSDGTEAYFSYDEYRKIEGDPQLGKTMTITFQRHPNNMSQQASKIDKAIVRD